MASEMNLSLSAGSAAVGLSDKSGHQAALSHPESGSSAAVKNGSPVDSVSQPVATSPTQQDKKAASAQQSENQRLKLEKQAQKLQELSSLKGWKVDFSVDQDLHQTVVKVIDSDTKSVIRQIPSEDMLALEKKLKAINDGENGNNSLSGLLFDHQI